MIAWIVAYLAAGAAMLGLDAIWLSLAAGRLYRPRLGDLLLENFRLAPAACFYVIYLFGILFLAVQPALASGRPSAALLRGAALGFVAYATYDLTNQATLKGWSAIVTIADLCWGTLLTAAAATAAYAAYSAMTGIAR